LSLPVQLLNIRTIFLLNGYAIAGYPQNCIRHLVGNNVTDDRLCEAGAILDFLGSETVLYLGENVQLLLKRFCGL
jgi:hypothetical protein